jgi:hypothetical protein
MFQLASASGKRFIVSTGIGKSQGLAKADIFIYFEILSFPLLILMTFSLQDSKLDIYSFSNTSI